jgi:hypothetical protein
LIEDTKATQRTIERRTPVVSSHQRSGNKSNSNPSSNLESIESVKIAAPERNEPAPVSRAHLRVIQNRRGSKFG